jgi:hypothetical protein
MEIRIDESGAEDLLNSAALVADARLLSTHQHPGERCARGVVIPT